MKNRKEQKTKTRPRNVKKLPVEKPGTGPKRTIREIVIEAITANKVITNDELIATVKAQFPKSAFKDSHAAWYRSQARKGSLTGAPIVIPPQRRPRSSN